MKCDTCGYDVIILSDTIICLCGERKMTKDEKKYVNKDDLS